jgi:hypothetical protein
MSTFGKPGDAGSFTTWPGGAEARFNSLKITIVPSIQQKGSAKARELYELCGKIFQKYMTSFMDII